MAATTSGNSFHYGKALGPGERAPAHYAASTVASRGRVYDEPPCPTRNNLQRDRDRIIHSTAFRRLTYKTQVFVYHEGDHYRTRLTHTLEVAQIARTMARQLCLDEDLAEAVALGHDLGHPPFGHAGEKALDRVLTEAGGFDHNVQSFRIVTALERKYESFSGLNLCWETLEGLAKHNGPPAGGAEFEDLRFVHALRKFHQLMDLQLSNFASGEAQVAALADDIAWHTHDIDDGLRAGLIDFEGLREVPLLEAIIDNIQPSQTNDPARHVYEVTRRLITIIIADAVDETRSRLRVLQPETSDDIRQADRSMIAFSTDMTSRLSCLRKFLFANLYRHPSVVKVMDGAQKVVRDLIFHYINNQTDLPTEWNDDLDRLSKRCRIRRIGDFVAGMTDRYAMEEHRRLFCDMPELRYSANHLQQH